MGEAERVCVGNESVGEVRGDVVMETPQRSQITTPVSKFEDSPVFNFINSLSPIKPLKSLHNTQSFNSLNLASLPSIFTSPHVSTLKESRFLKRHQISDPSKPEFSSGEGSKGNKNDVNGIPRKSSQNQENIDPVGEASVGASCDNHKVAIEVSGTLSYGHVTADCSAAPRQVAEAEYISENGGKSTPLAPLVQSTPGKCLFKSDMQIEETGQIDQNKEPAGSDWENLITDESDLLIFESPNDAVALKDSCQNSVDSGTRFCSSFINDFPKIKAVGEVDRGEQYELEIPSTQPGEGKLLKEVDESQGFATMNSPDTCTEEGIKIDDESDPNCYHGIRRRCLVYEMVGTRIKHMDESSGSAQPEGNINCSDGQLASVRRGNDSSRCILPGIGLHLNSLATTPKFNNAVNSEGLVSGVHVTSGPASNSSFHSLAPESSNTSFVVITSEANMDSSENGIPMIQDTSQAFGYAGSIEEINPSSPKKKRRKLESVGESEGCKRCNCKKSKCLKLYCECFAAGLYCVEPCSCVDCFNKPIYEATVLATRKQIESRNPLAFAPKVIRGSDTLPDTGDEYNKTPASARHKRGCNCKKSGCLKKYCECYQGGVGCSINCRCEGCKNAFGRKDGSTSIGSEIELEEEEPEICGKTTREKHLEKVAVHNDDAQNLDTAHPTTPLRFGRQAVRLPFSSKGKPPRSLLSVGSSSGTLTSQRLGKPDLIQPQLKFDSDPKTIQEEDEMPEILLQKNNGSPSGVKSVSPNSKRVSPPHCDFEPSPARRSSRKLILKSIPSFPSLTPKHC